jgi:aminoglycoside phosphotransferase family enzyme
MLPDPGLVGKVDFLSQPASYPEPTRHVEVVQTHMSWVFLTRRHAFKLKKPVRTGYLDYGTVSARRRHCAEEVRLNRRFCPDVYLGIVPVTIDSAGQLHLDGEGRAVDWVVKMRRLPARRMLDRAIREGTVRDAAVRGVVDVLWRVYRQCPPVPMSATAYRSRLAREIAANRRALGKPDYRLPPDAFVPTCARLLAKLANAPELFDVRVQGGRIVEGHGDLRPEHICLTREPQIIDCIEFSRAFRILDVADELAYLGLECDGWARRHSRGAFRCLRARSGDVVPDVLVDFYQASRACLRAKIALWNLDEPGPRGGRVWIEKAHAYLALAHEHAARVR